MSRWQNWSGRQVSSPGELHFARSREDVQAVVSHSAAAGLKIRAAGAGHSHSPIVDSDGVIIDCSGLSGLLAVDTSAQRAWMRAGSPVYALGAQLHEHGLALKNQGDIDRQFLAGAISTGTHGTGKDLQNLSAGLTALELVLADGECVQCDSNRETELFQVARLGMGSVGLITAIEMQLGPSQVLKEQSWQASLEEITDRIPDLCDAHERFEFFWYPQSNEATVKTIDPVNAEPQYPIASEGRRQGYSFEVLPSHRPHRHTEMEYSVPAEYGPECLQAIARLLREKFPDIVWPVEYRTVAADDVWLSMAYGRSTVTISVHQDIREPDEPYYRACEEVFRQYDGRPHWGKVNYLGGEDFAGSYDRWDDWWRVRDLVDPKMVFLNPWAESIRP